MASPLKEAPQKEAALTNYFTPLKKKTPSPASTSKTSQNEDPTDDYFDYGKDSN